ncbi:MAG: hypothetical protein HOB84_15695 [Candidatus Marinimicrobia bacterium]|nr:hypothetical protein [Candidatus Neomarinimicrobiota bacterium]MBT4359693.1 hypothetical protein [Candidatus Neomarinimicrobiota bacterium]MBT4716212.1 hypothetical protein [Candidatus Neomarinimicrobiota bacterium]MBT4946215.1 hypothetical protein [Candidatus Neomarinimicrobiota bacterium]MBT5269715.1 hypothetical protein [Candidatus Neomarinimicrobiota bacterium]
MKSRLILQFLILQLVTGLSFAGDLRVNIINGTNNGPGNADRVVLIDLGAGMAEIASASNVVKATTFSDVTSSGQSQYLIRATLGGVNYSAMFVPTPGVTAWETSLTVYETSETIHDVNASVPFFVIYGFEDKLYIQKRIVLENVSSPPVTFSASPGLAKVHVPKNVTELENLTFKSGSMPVRTAPIDSDQGQVLPNPIKPGLSEIDMSYYTAYDPGGTSLTELVGYDIDHFHVYTMPLDLSISAPGLSREGTDNENGLAIYAIEGIKAGTMLEFQVSGKGMSDSGTDDHNHSEQQNTGKIVIENRIDANVELAVAGVLILAILISLFVSVTQQSEDLKQESIEMLKKQKSELLQQYAKLGDSSSDADDKDKLLYRLVSVYKTLDRID